jgi:NAD(P)H-quinone oxidoreductase subunit 5
VFLGESQAKTRRAPEVAWPMAVPMVSLIIITLLAPLAPLNWPLWLSPVTPLVNNSAGWVKASIPLLILSGMIGCGIAAMIPSRRYWSRYRQLPLRFFQDLFAYDFYLDKVYDVTVVAAVSNLSRFAAWVDRYIVDGAVNLVSLATIFSGNALKYNVSGQSQFYIFTILLGISLLLWLMLSSQWSVIVDYWSSWLLKP